MDKLNRRDFLKLTGVGVISLVVGSSGVVRAMSGNDVLNDLDSNQQSIPSKNTPTLTRTSTVAPRQPTLTSRPVDQIYAEQTSIAINASNCVVDSGFKPNYDVNGKPVFKDGVGYDGVTLVTNGIHYRLRRGNEPSPVRQGDGCYPADDNLVFEGFYLAADGHYYKIGPVSTPVRR